LIYVTYYGILILYIAFYCQYANKMPSNIKDLLTDVNF